MIRAILTGLLFLTSTLWACADVTAFGADPTGVKSSTAAIQAAIEAGGSVHFPAGHYSCGPIVIDKSVVFTGDGSGNTVITFTQSGGDCVNICSGVGAVSVQQISFVAGANESSGALIDVTGSSQVAISDVLLNGPYHIGIQLNNFPGGPTDIARVHIIGGTASSIGVLAANPGPLTSLRDVCVQGLGTGSPGYGIVIAQADDMLLDHVTGSGCAIGLFMTGGAECEFNDCIFDLCQQDAFLNGTGSSFVQSITFKGCWFGDSGQNGLVIEGNTAQVDLIGCHTGEYTGLGNQGSGIIIYCPATGVHINACTISGNQDFGVYVGPNVYDFTITNSRIGSARNPNGYGIAIGSGDAAYIITNNSFLGNNGGAILGTISPGTIVNNNM
jgi:hypothetical protein